VFSITLYNSIIIFNYSVFQIARPNKMNLSATVLRFPLLLLTLFISEAVCQSKQWTFDEVYPTCSKTRTVD
jgi:hypothetical protein